MTKLLLDQGLPRSTATILRTAGWDVTHVSEVDMSRATDEEILEYTEQNQCICVTLDSDFHAMLAVTDARSPSVIRLRIERLNGEDLAGLLLKIWPKIEKRVNEGSMVTVTERTVRVRRLPLSENS